MKNEKKFENFIQNRGKKQKAEKLVKNTFKHIQKNTKKESAELLKRSIILSAEGVALIKQTLKKGKRKRVVPKTLLLLSEKSKISSACSNISKHARSASGKSYHIRLADVITGVCKKSNEYRLTNSINMIDRKADIKFRW